jgi:DNA-binding Lrp family transcriptional regulator
MRIGAASRRLVKRERFCWIARGRHRQQRAARRQAMIPFFVQIKCNLGKSYEVANALADAEIASEIYSTAGDFDLLVKFYVDQGTDIGHFVNEKVQTLPGIQDTRTIITFKAF